MPDEKQRPHIDLCAIEFPTDRLTLGQLRRRQPELFNGRIHHPESINAIDVVATMWLEQKLAIKAFAAAVGLPDPDPDPLVERKDAIRMLDEDYCRFGISSGIQQTRQLVRGFETAAAGQAKAYSKPNR